MIRHSTVETSYLLSQIEKMVKRGLQQDMMEGEDGVLLTNDAALSVLRRGLEQGRIAWGCPDPAPNGTCPGHEEV